MRESSERRTQALLRGRALPLHLIALYALSLLACSEQNPMAAAPDASPSFDVSEHASTPASVGWLEQARLLVSANRLNPVAAGRIYAALAVAQYGAVVATDDQGYEDDILPQVGYGPGGRARFETERGAVAGASSLVLKYFFPTAAAALEQRVRDEGDALSGQTHPHFQRGLEVGMNSANQMIDRVKRDRFTASWTGTVPVGAGMWVSNGLPFLPLHGNVLSYFLTTGSQFRPAPPPAFGSPAFVAELEEVKMYSATRTAEQLASALYWNSPVGTPTPPGYWSKVASDYITYYRLNERAATHVYALTQAAILDASIGCWDAKYHYWTLRPSQADASITLPIGLPNHPSYPSGHSCVSAAAATVLSRFFPAQTAELEDRLEQSSLSRIYAGIHYRFDTIAGQGIGRAVGHLAIEIDQSSGLLSVLR